ncbi:DUF5724 domain-containing protein [Cellulophaga sp. RHA19]|uniref:DUF5724 domain-containing protein n=1 Tax=Cellulophaga sp. RHA19 TaxID=1798237 RepID=UPI0018E24CA9|nr:hypothetical protein [Cellulophaga sp. RHA19]
MIIDTVTFFAVVLEFKGELVDEVVKDIIQAEDEIGGISRDIIKGLLLTKKEEYWELVAKLLLAAQRQEGLRQTILESIDTTSLGALKIYDECNFRERFNSF